MKELMKKVDQSSNERERLAAAVDGKQSIAASHTPKMIGFIYRLVEPEVKVYNKMKRRKRRKDNGTRQGTIAHDEGTLAHDECTKTRRRYNCTRQTHFVGSLLCHAT